MIERFDSRVGEYRGQAAKLRVQSAERLQHKVTDALSAMHATLEPPQRERLAYLLRTGTLVM